MILDLHTHTNFSACANRENTWESLLVKAQEKRVEILSITDHNTCIFHVMKQFIDTKRFFQGDIISGMECDVVENGLTFEVLAYNFDVMKMFNWALKTYGTLETRQTKIKDALVSQVKDKGFVISSQREFNSKSDYAHKFVYDEMATHSENKNFLNEHQIKNSSDFYRLSTTDKNFPLYMDMSQFWPSVDSVVEAIHNAGGLVVLAHPYGYKGEASAERLLGIALKKGFDGIEVYHPSCDEEKNLYLRNFASRNHLLITGGSDYHGNKKHGNKKEGNIGIEVYGKIQNELTGREK